MQIADMLERLSSGAEQLALSLVLICCLGFLHPDMTVKDPDLIEFGFFVEIGLLILTSLTVCIPPSTSQLNMAALLDVPYSQPPSKPIRRKFRTENQVTESQEPSATVGGPAPVANVKPHPTVQKQSSKQKKAIQTAIRKNKEANAVLARLNSELQQQLKEVHQERIALENQLEQLRPVTVL
ncbi:RalBP1-associated Eps domain-containing protein 2 [Galemys pyrenaicus]|uniref:RalBP1-associated Eps domain-containing protein 2 n=1 Tax=Galemys pyrenaicus TaxID=202257 RepID=A0A8J5ZZN2_GALPY|nr:RalBP1-associated Eps domain-containing protein 2 [Galemys pyrenaicus]